MPDTPADGKPAEGADTGKPEDKAPWTAEDFDAERAWRLVQSLRAERDGLKTERDDARKEAEEFRSAASKTGDERDKALAAATKRAEDAERSLAIRKHNLPDDVVEEFADYLTGTPDEVEAKAARLAARLAPKPPEGDGGDKGGDKGGDGSDGTSEIPGRPKPRLTPGDSSGDDDAGDFDPEAIARAARERSY